MKYRSTNHLTNADEPIAEANVPEDRKAAARRRMREQYIFVLGPKRYYVRATGRLITRREFNLRNTDIVPYGSSPSAHVIYINDPQRRMADRTTYRPFQGDLIQEGHSLLVNTWRAPARALTLATEDIETAFREVAKPLKLLEAKRRRDEDYGYEVLRTYWPFRLTKLKADGRDNLWLPVGRKDKPLGCEQRAGAGFYDYEQCAPLAWQFTCDPREIVVGGRMQGDDIFLYRDGVTESLRDLEDYLGRVGRLIAEGTGENASIYAGHLLSTLPKK